jgi:hypothetical protein
MRPHIGKVVRVEFWDHTSGRIADGRPLQEGTKGIAWGAVLGRVRSVKDGIVMLAQTSIFTDADGEDDIEYFAVVEAAIRKLTIYSRPWR